MSILKRFTGAGFLFPVFLFVMTTAYLAAAFNIRTMFGADGGVGPRTMPIVSAIIMYGALLIVIVKEVRGPQKERENTLASHVRPILVALATGGYIWLFIPLGYILSTMVFVAVLFAIFQYQIRNPLKFLLYDVIITAVFYGLFAGIFEVRLPTLTGGFL